MPCSRPGRLRLAAFAAAGALLTLPALAAQPTLVAPTDRLAPEQERATFKLPPGFEIQLVAAEPEIAKPMNIAFDARGRLWVTDTVEYPWPVKDGQVGRDSVKVLSDFAADGKARKVTTFASGLNIPLGVLPVGDPAKGEAALVYSIPQVRRYRDTDGDGKADKVEPLLGTYGTVDTHGMTNNFVRGFDGWVYANHGFRNDSVVKGVDGSTITMNSGNTYRFRPDGTRVELFARGQVNPFGLAFDPAGNLYSADCHTRPQYLLLRGAVYPSFGKPDDGLGYGPEMCLHDHGSTGIAGTMFYDDARFPAEYRGNLFNGNPVTNIVNRDRIEWAGSTPKAVEAGDFLVSSDPWFRPVQVALGPDGAVYVADFYNKIIGHYEVDLKHPGRDRASGRIWRIVYKGDAKDAPAPKLPDLTAADPAKLVAALGDPNITVRLLATNLLADRADPAAVPLLEKVVREPAAGPQKAHAAWVLERIGKLRSDLLGEVANDPSASTSIHAMRMLAERAEWSDVDRKLAFAGLADADPTARRAAADAVGRHPDALFAPLLLVVKAATPPADTHLVHATRMALRDHLAVPGMLAKVLAVDGLSDGDRLTILDAALGAQSPEAGTFAARMASEADLPRDLAVRSLKHAVKLAANEAAVGHIAAAASRKFADDVDLQLDLLKSVREGLAARGGAVPGPVKQWASGVATKVLAADPDRTDAALAWSNRPTDEQPASADPWVTQVRASADGKPGTFFASLPKGEKLTGVLRSKPFAAPATLSLWVAGHNGEPPKKEPVKNVVRLRAVDGWAVLAEAVPPRNDTAQKVTWDLSQHAGKQVFLEATDGDARDAYAWLAFGRLEPAVVPIPPAGVDQRKRIESAAELAGAMKLASLAEPVRKLLATPSADPAVRSAAAKAVANIDPAGAVQPLVAVLTDGSAPAAVREAAAAALGTVREMSAVPAMVTALTVAPQGVQRSLALAMAGTKDGGEALLGTVGAGKASPRLLTDKAVVDRLRAAGDGDLDAKLAALTKGLPDADAAVQKLIDARARAFASAGGSASIERGQAVFAKNCAACHRVGNEGAQVGPQLDGANKRGADRLAEDILDPSRNVDGAFRNSVLTLADGDVVTGLQRRVEGESVVFADSAGKEFSVPQATIKKRVESQLSLMPSNFGEIIPEPEFRDLMAFLMAR